jgi:hypothetical protein
LKFDKNLLPGSYTYRVRAFNAGGNSGFSNEATATIGGGTPPAAPTGLTAVAGPGLQIRLNWTDKSNDEDGFSIERRTGAAGFAPLTNVGPNIQTFTDTNVLASTAYVYQVRAFKGGLSSNPTNEAGATTPGPQPPNAPSNLQASVISTTRIDLSWTDNSTDEDGFKIERKIGAGAFAPLQTLGANVTSFSDTTVSASTTYTYRVRSFNAAGGDSAWSNEQQATTPAPPTPPTAPSGLTAAAVSSSQINLTWADTSGNEDGFRLERKIGAGNFALHATLGAGLTSFSDTGLQGATTYGYRIKAFNAVGESAFSNEASATTSTPPACQVSLLSGDGVAGYAEGAAGAARWKNPMAAVVAIDPASGQPALFVADTDNHRIRMIFLGGPNAGASILIAGDGTAGLTDGAGSPQSARFNGPRGIAAFTSANGVVTSLMVCDTNNHALRKILWTGAWKVLTISSTAGAGFVDSATPSQVRYSAPEGAIAGTDGFLYVADTGNGVVRKVDQNGGATTKLKKGSIAAPSGITQRRTTGVLYVSDATANRIWSVDTTAVLVAGSGAAGFADGTGTAAVFNGPSQLSWASTPGGEVVYIADRNNNRIRTLKVATNAVVTLAGSGSASYGEGDCATASFKTARGVAAGSASEVYVADSGNNRIRKVQ